jgi:hypothetical protein
MSCGGPLEKAVPDYVSDLKEARERHRFSGFLVDYLRRSGAIEE